MAGPGPPAKLRCHFYNINGDYLATIPVTGLSFGSTLNGQGSFTGTVPLGDAQVRGTDPWYNTQPGATIVAVDQDGVPLEAYFITSRVRHNGSDGPSIQLTGQSLWWWLTKRLQATDYSNPQFRPYNWGGVTPAPGTPGTPMPYWAHQPYGADAIAAQILLDALEYAAYGTDAPTWAERNGGVEQSLVASAFNILGGGDPDGGGLTVWVNGAPPHPGYVAPPYSGGTVISPEYWISPTFAYSSMATLDSILQSLTGLGYMVGIDITLPVWYAGADTGNPSPYGQRALKAAINISYPQCGRYSPGSYLKVDMTRARQYDLTEDATAQGVIMYETGVVGATTGFENVAPLTGTPPWPMLEQVNSFSGVVDGRVLTGGQNSVLSMLQALAQSESFAASFPVFSGTVRVPLFGADPPFGATGGAFSIGDSCIVWMPADYDNCFPDGIDQVMRIVSWQANIASEGDQTVDLTLNMPPGLGKVTFPALPGKPMGT
jgi:hypothetical protein